MCLTANSTCECDVSIIQVLAAVIVSVMCGLPSVLYLLIFQ
jgi:hypothetical protein